MICLFSIGVEYDILLMVILIQDIHLQTIYEVLDLSAGHFQHYNCNLLMYCSIQLINSSWSMFVDLSFQATPKKKVT